MAFENVDVSSLKKAINSCKQSINYSASSEMIGVISGNNIWSFPAKENLKGALNKLCDTRYKNLIDYLNKCTTVVGYIEQYKEEEDKIKNYQSQITNLNSKISSTKSSYKVCSGDTLSKISRNFGVSINDIVDANGFDSANDTIYVGQNIIIPDSSDISSYKSQISSLKNKISQCRKTMEDLETKVSNNID